MIVCVDCLWESSSHQTSYREGTVAGTLSQTVYTVNHCPSTVFTDSSKHCFQIRPCALNSNIFHSIINFLFHHADSATKPILTRPQHAISVASDHSYYLHKQHCFYTWIINYLRSSSARLSLTKANEYCLDSRIFTILFTSYNNNYSDIVLTLSRQKTAKKHKRWYYYPPSHRINVNVLLSNDFTTTTTWVDSWVWTQLSTHVVVVVVKSLLSNTLTLMRCDGG